MKRLRWLSILMALTILGIAGFLVYWLNQNYDREDNALAIKSEITFRETMEHLQIVKMKLNGFSVDSSKRSRIKVYTEDLKGGINFKPERELVSTINVVRGKLNDSLNVLNSEKNSMVITMKDLRFSPTPDSNVKWKDLQHPGENQLISILYGVDSLQDSLKINDIHSAYARAMQEQKLNIPFSIKRLDTARSGDPVFNEVTVGLVRPITYRLVLGNTFSYLVKRIGLPILFSFLLLGITILSFVLLYRTLLKQQRLAEIKNEFINNITHELKTPIATVGVAIEALRNFNAIHDPQKTKEYLDISSNELQRLSLLVDKVLKLSMFEKHEVELQYEPVNIKGIVEEVTNSMRLQLEKNEVDLTSAEEGDLNMKGDKLHLQSVIFNLIDNAIKYGKENPAIHITMREDGNKIVVEVADNGIGIPPEYKAKVFEKFFRIPHGNIHNAKGYGLGLSYAAHVVEKHNGSILLESQAGIGSRFIVTLPKSRPV